MTTNPFATKYKAKLDSYHGKEDAKSVSFVKGKRKAMERKLSSSKSSALDSKLNDSKRRELAKISPRSFIPN